MSLRSWATPTVMGAFLVMAITGILMFFHLDAGLNKGLHEWAGMVMVAGGLAHVALNWRAFLLYFRRPLARVLLAGFAAVLALSFAPASMLPGGAAGGGLTPRVMFGALQGARIETLAELTGQSPADLQSRLADAGISGAEPGATVDALAAGDQGRARAILATAFAQSGTR